MSPATQQLSSGFKLPPAPDTQMDGAGAFVENLVKPSITAAPVRDKTALVLGKHAFVPATINQYLRDYQQEGIQFLYNNFRRGHGSLLADDMGLGKTIQVRKLSSERKFFYFSTVLCSGGLS